MEGKYSKGYDKTDYQLELLSKELVEMHREGAIDLAEWPKALTIVKRYFRVNTTLEFTKLVDKKLENSKFEDEKYQHRPNC